MSLGYCGKCKLIEQDNKIVRYAYSGENWNDDNSVSGDIDLFDGRICIYKRCLEEPEIHTKKRKLQSGIKTTFEKRIVHMPSIGKHIADGDIIIEKKCKNEFMRTSEVNSYLAKMLLLKIFETYQRNGVLPEKESFLQ